MSYATVDSFIEFLTIQVEQIDDDSWPDKAVLQRNLDFATAEIDISRQTSDQLDCNISGTVAKYLELLNIVCAMLLTPRMISRFACIAVPDPGPTRLILPPRGTLEWPSRQMAGDSSMVPEISDLWVLWPRRRRAMARKRLA